MTHEEIEKQNELIYIAMIYFIYQVWGLLRGDIFNGDLKLDNLVVDILYRV